MIMKHSLQIAVLALALTSTAVANDRFFFSPENSEGLKPTELSGDMRDDWLKHAASAEVCVVDEVPAEHILLQWHRLGVKILKRVAWDPECSAERFRRVAGFLAVREGADGVWLVGEERFSPAWKQALAEAKIDAAVARYARALAQQALGWREKDNKVWIEGRRVLWFFKFMDIESENLDTMRLEFICYAKRLEQLLGVTPKKLPLVVSKPDAPADERFVPLQDQAPSHVAVSLDRTEPVELSDGLTFSCNKNSFGFKIASEKGTAGCEWPGGKGSFKLYLPDGKGAYLPYEFRIDLTPVETNRAPDDCYGLWFLQERWGKGIKRLYGDPRNWRLKPYLRRSYGPNYPKLQPRFDFKKDGKGGWTLNLSFSWFSLYGFWPSMRNGIVDKWYVALDELPGVPSAAVRLDWAKGREINFKKLAARISCADITERYAEQKAQACGIYRLWYDERLYGFAKTKTPTYQRCDPEGDKMFWERIVEPMVDANKNLEEITYTYRDADRHWVPAPLEKQSEVVKDQVRKSLGKLFNLADRVSLARRDYILQRHAGEVPPEPPPKKPPEGAATLTAPDVDHDDNAIQLDDKEF